tara:strand:+ start:65 stop:223 length:159 start_codon:yes stop_codon:yes gene_type:complete
LKKHSEEKYEIRMLQSMQRAKKDNGVEERLLSRPNFGKLPGFPKPLNRNEIN